MTTQTPTPSLTTSALADNEGIVASKADCNQRLLEIQSQLNSQRTLFFTGFGLMWATMVGGFIAVFVAVLSIDP